MLSWTRKLRSAIKNVRHIIFRALFIALIGLYIRAAFLLTEKLYDESGPNFWDAIDKYGKFLTIILYGLTLPVYLNVPALACNLIGLILYNPFKTVKRNVQINTDTPFICFRVVTRGLFPKLVAEVTEKNLATCRNVGITNFKFEIVTDTTLGIQQSHNVRELVVPQDYHTPNGTLFKARALHYSLDRNVNILSPDDWIVHLDEETLLSESVLYGIINFVSEQKSDIGQGVITYGESGIENWLTTLLDGMRVAIDYGLFRLGLQFFHRPLFGFKGSFIVVKMKIEDGIGFDFGPKESIAEDLRFALAAWDSGYKFDFVEGAMKEKSTFSLSDYVKQRKRWFIGHFQIVWGNTLPLYCKSFVMLMNISNMVLWTSVLNSILSFLCPVPLKKWQLFLFLLLTFHLFLLLLFGNFKSLCARKYSLLTRILVSFLSQGLVPVLGVAEAYSTMKGFLHRNKLTFDIVQKETSHQLKTSQTEKFSQV
ncbi:beta-1,4-mannosyltransferase egh-like [Ruditapes philippinarum]|uniref:beta-1,4-mannosyltransferase egh-like n=1 Tax=Ruditapes philippinarum TaxID=129788 RepID=UPI00295AE079|nr:beta-1,4-mannosyltransferase egh-like [Ruditapes philippinarum]